MSFAIIILVAGMLASGGLNTLLLKYQDQSCEAISSAATKGCASFPVLQSLAMFIGESLCFLVIGIIKLRTYLENRTRARKQPLLRGDEYVGEYTALPSNESEDATLLTSTARKSLTKQPLQGAATLYMSLPAICDICGTTTMSVGLLLVPASVFQMCRGSLVLFVGLFSVIFLRRRLVLHQWLALLLVTLGVFIVGLSNVVKPDVQNNVKETVPATESALLGISLIVGAQLFTATQFVIEEWVLARYAIEPLKVAGLEGVFGTIISTGGILIAYYTYGNTARGTDGTFDANHGLHTVLAHVNIWSAFMLFAISIATFNYCGLSVTHRVSATSRSTIDTCRTILIWSISMLLGWEHFKWLQLLGFVVLVYATLLFNGVLPPPNFFASAREPEVQGVQEHVLE